MFITPFVIVLGTTLGTWAALTVSTKAMYSKVKNKDDIKNSLKYVIDNVLSENGCLYHFTSEQSLNDIIKSKELRPSSRFKSYSPNKKCFFFPTIPNLDEVSLNLKDGKVPEKMCALKIKPTKEQLNEFKIRELI